MICTNCKRKLSDTSKYCPRCGYLFPSCDVKKYSYENYELLNYYIKDNKVSSVFGISPYFFFFSFSYSFLKRLYLIGIYSFISYFFLLLLLKNGIKYILGSMGFFFLPVVFSFMICVFIHFYYSFNFNNLYIENALRKIARLERIYYKDDKKVKEACEKDGKNNYFIFLLSIIFFILLLIKFIF